MRNTGTLAYVKTADWKDETIPSWRHSIWVGVFDPWPVLRRSVVCVTLPRVVTLG
jgi:MPBQ/MSBQ methyltransferase